MPHYFKSYLFKDHNQIANLGTPPSSLARDAGIARTTVSEYLQILEDTLLASTLAPYPGKLRVKQPQRSKLYWIDPGLVRAVKKQLTPPSQEETGHLLEGLLLMMLRTYRDHKGLYEQEYYWAADGKGSVEVDFLLQRQQEFIGIEVKATTRWRSELGKGLRALDSARPLTKKIVVYLGKQSGRTKDGIEILPFDVFSQMLAEQAL